MLIKKTENYIYKFPLNTILLTNKRHFQMKKKIIILGAGGFAKSILDSLNYTEYEVHGFIDSYKNGTHQGFPILANSLTAIENPNKYYFCIGIGDPKTRIKFLNSLQEKKLNLVNIIDPTALISNQVEIGNCVYIGKMCIVNRDTNIGDGVVINTRSIVEHGSTISACSNISTNVVLNGEVNVGTGSFVGSCTVVNNQITIGDNSIIGSGSVVVKNIPDNIVVAGSPTKTLRENK